MINYFEILNVSENAEDEVIRAAYKSLAKKYHPDNTNLSLDVAERKMREINEAYDVLIDKSKRNTYIKSIHMEHTQRESSPKRESATENNVVDNSINDYPEEIGIFEKVIWIVIIVSLMCCTIYFVPDLIGKAISNIINELPQIIATFK